MIPLEPRPIEYPGNVTPAPYQCSKEMLEFKASLVMSNTEELTGWPLMFRERLYKALISRAWILGGEGHHG